MKGEGPKTPTATLFPEAHHHSSLQWKEGREGDTGWRKKIKRETPNLRHREKK